KLGAKVTAIDISPIGIDIVKRRAAFNGVAIDAQIMACPTTFADESFDVIHGLGILHHVGVDTAMNDVKRLLKTGGVACFLEPVGDVRFLEYLKRKLHKKLVGKLDLIRVNDLEENLRWAQLEPWKREFAECKLIPYHLLFRVRKFFPAAFAPYFRRLD